MTTWSRWHRSSRHGFRPIQEDYVRAFPDVGEDPRALGMQAFDPGVALFVSRS
jgi:hypothetical protein